MVCTHDTVARYDLDSSEGRAMSQRSRLCAIVYTDRRRGAATRRRSTGSDVSYAIYVVEDEDSLRDLIVSYLERASYAPRAFPDAERAREALADGADLWILDINLPGLDGFEFLNMIRDTDPEVPVIYISARDRDIDRVVGLEVGADDYLPKPFLPRELVIRVNRILSRVYGDRERKGADTTKFQIGAYVLDSVKREVRSDRGRGTTPRSGSSTTWCAGYGEN